MKKGICFALVVLVAVWMSGCASSKKEMVMKELAPTVVAFPGVVKMDKKATVTLMGAGFKPGQRIYLMIVTDDGVTTDIGYSFKPDPVPDERGAWFSEWKDCGRFISGELIKAGVYTVTVTDGNYNPIAQVPISFVEEKKEKTK
jgi:hypothetical protein